MKGIPFLNHEFYKEISDNFPDLENKFWDYFHKLASSNNSTHLVMKKELWFLGIINSSKTAQSVLSEASVFRGKWPTWGCLSSGRLLYCMERIFSSLSQGTPVCYTESIHLLKTRHISMVTSVVLFFYYTL